MQGMEGNGLRAAEGISLIGHHVRHCHVGCGVCSCAVCSMFFVKDGWEHDLRAQVCWTCRHQPSHKEMLPVNVAAHGSRLISETVRTHIRIGTENAISSYVPKEISPTSLTE